MRFWILNPVRNDIVLVHVIIVISLLGCQAKASNIDNKKTDSLNIWIEKGRDESKNRLERIESLKKAFQTQIKISRSTGEIKSALRIVDIFYEINEDSLFSHYNEETYNLSNEFQDSLSIAEYHWNKGLIFINSYIRLHVRIIWIL